MHPTFAIGSNQSDNTIQIRAGETFLRKNLPHLFALALRSELDVTMFDGFDAPDVIMFGLGPEKVAGRHRKTVGQQIRETHDQDNDGRKLRADHASNHCERRHRTIDATIYPIPKIVMAWSFREPLLDRLN